MRYKFITLIILIIFAAAGIFSTSAEALNFGIYAETSYLYFFDDRLDQTIEEPFNGEGEDEEYISLSYDNSLAWGFNGGGWVEIMSGVPLGVEYMRLTTADSDRVPPEVAEAEGDVRKELVLNAVRASIGMNLAEFTEIYEVPSIVLFAGGGYYFGSYEQDGELEIREEERWDIREDDEGASLGFHVGAIYEHEITELFSARMSAKFRTVNIEFDQNYNLGGVELSAGATLTF